MMRFLTLSLLFLMACSTLPPKTEGPELSIQEINANKWTGLTKQNLEHLLQVYDLTPLLFTRKVQIESKVIPSSHPVLTLNTRYAEAPLKLLSLFIHEQLHWWSESNSAQVEAAKKELRALFPTLPTVGVARNVESTYLHLLICSLEYRSLVHFLGKKEADKLLAEMIDKDNVYPWVYSQVANKYSEISGIIKKHSLDPIKADQKPTKKP